LNTPFFSPRNLAAKFNLLSPFRLARNAADPATRRVAYIQAREGFRAVATLSTTLGLLDLVPGVDVTWDPRKSEFGKVRIGTAVYDPTGGVAHAARWLVNMGRSFAAIERGEELGEGRTPLDLTKRYLRSQLSPTAAVAADYMTGETFAGEEFTRLGAARDLIVPMTVADMYEGWVDAGGSTMTDAYYHAKHGGRGPDLKTGLGGAARGLPAALGFGVNFYEKPTDWEAKREAAKVNVPGRAGEELRRLGIDLNFQGERGERADKREGEFRQLPSRVGSVVDTSVGFDGGNTSQRPEHLEAVRREYERLLAEAVEREMAKPGYAQFPDDAARKRYLSGVVAAVRGRVVRGFNRETRGREIETLERVKETQDRLERRMPPPAGFRPAPKGGGR
jgi:hypothetical protein